MLNANAQNDSLHHLKVVEIKATRSVYFSSASKFQLIDSATLERYSNNNLADLLAHESMVFIKSYGLGSLASSSFRGAGSSHTAVLWNGFNLQSSMHGMIDLSLIPANFLNTVQLQFGSASALWGSGAVGGAIHLNNSNTFNKGISVYSNTSFGSFLDKQQQLSFELSKKRIVSTLKVFNHDAKNDFEFTNRAQYGKPKQRQRNAELKQYGLLQENYIQINQFQLLNTRYWYQYSDRQMPPSMTQNVNVAIQKDESSRFTTEY
jgi:iron complex outermembrane receptor protein